MWLTGIADKITGGLYSALSPGLRRIGQGISLFSVNANAGPRSRRDTKREVFNRGLPAPSDEQRAQQEPCRN